MYFLVDIFSSLWSLTRLILQPAQLSRAPFISSQLQRPPWHRSGPFSPRPDTPPVYLSCTCRDRHHADLCYRGRTTSCRRAAPTAGTTAAFCSARAPDTVGWCRRQSWSARTPSSAATRTAAMTGKVRGRSGCRRQGCRRVMGVLGV